MKTKLPGTNSIGMSTTEDGKRCPIYSVWKSMRSRCYSPKLLQKYPTYIGCSVCEEWLEFANFRSWAVAQDWQGKQLDKDIIQPGNKVYCPEKCVFVSRQLNSLLNDKEASRGDWPIGVYHLGGRKFQATISINAKRKHIGYFDCPIEAHRAYIKRKIEYIETFIQNETDPRIINGLRLHQQRISNYENGSESVQERANSQLSCSSGDY